MAFEESAGRFSISTLPRIFQGYEIRKAQPEDLIIQHSARDEARVLGGLRKDLKFWFRNTRKAVSQALWGKDYSR